MRLASFLIAIFLIPLILFGSSENKIEKIVQAKKSNEKIRIDGILDEDVWGGDGYSDFVQSEPIDGGEPTEKTEVWIAYDESFLYVAARLYDSEPNKIVSRLVRRDEIVDSDCFEFAVDPYFDRRSGFLFVINPSGSIADAIIYNDSWRDFTWDGVWEGKTKIDERGWCVEIKIPFNQLRFPKKEIYTWGVNFHRFIKRKNEMDNFVWIPKGERGYVSHFAKLVGIENIKPGRLADLFPYSVGRFENYPSEPGNPFRKGNDLFGGAGIDFKIGLKSNLTLDATINPDFGQVEVDPAVINLTAFETFYMEKRPFFIEGANIFDFGYGGAENYITLNWGNPSFFYSRRIGRAPQGYVSTDGHVISPDRTTILSAFKITGKLSGWNLGFINAITAREYAEVDLNGERYKEEVEPFSYYGVLRTQKEFNEGRQAIGLIATSVLRDIRNENLSSILNKRALCLGFDGWTFLDKEKTWVLTGWIGGSSVEGSKEDILKLQMKPQHYFQRPDAEHLNLNENATSLKGWAGRLMLSKERGNFFFNTAIGAISPGFDTNDLGFQRGGDVINAHILFGYAWFKPGKIFRNWSVGIATSRNYDFGKNKIGEDYFTFFEARFLNYWRINLITAFFPESLDKNLTRGGPLTVSPSGYFSFLDISSDSRKPFVLSLDFNYSALKPGDISWESEISLRWKPRSNLQISFGPEYSYAYSTSQWVKEVDDPIMKDTYGKRYIFSDLKSKNLSSNIRVNWTFNPKLTFQIYLQPFLAVGKYSKFKELSRPRTYNFNVFGEGNSIINFEDGIYTVDPDGDGIAPPFSFYNPDFNFKSLRGTAVLRWEYLPGSVLYFVWTQTRQDYTYPGELRLKRDMDILFRTPAYNIFLIKIVYRLPI